MLRLSREGAEVFVRGDDQTLEWVVRRSCLGILHSSVDQRERGWLVVGGKEQVSPRSWAIHKRRHASGEGCDFLVDERDKLIVVDLPPGPWRWLYTLRMVRNILRWELLEKGAVFLHASCVSLEGRGIALTGPKRSGKSSLIVSALRERNCDYVTDDDLTIIPREDGRLVGLGWPGSLRVRRSMLTLYPEVSEHLGDLQHPANKLEENLDPDVGVIRIFPEELQAMFGCRVRSDAPLALVASVQWGVNDIISKLSLAERVATLTRAWDMLPERKAGTLPTPPPAGRWIDQVFDPFLLPHYAVGTLATQKGLLQDVAEEIPGVSIVHSAGTFPAHLASRMRGAKGGESAFKEEASAKVSGHESGCKDGGCEG